MPLLEVTLVQELAGQQVINRFNYLSAGTPAAVSLSFAMAYAFGAIADGTPPTFPTDTMLDDIRNLTSNALDYKEMVVKRLYSVTDFYTVPFNNMTGKVAEASASPFIAFGAHTNRTRLDINRGQKRFAGVTEGSMDSGGVVASGAKAVLDTLCIKMGETLEYDDEGNTITFTPVILGRDPEPVNAAGKKTYPLYPTETEQLEHLMSSLIWSAFDVVRSQTSRQYGQGS